MAKFVYRMQSILDVKLMREEQLKEVEHDLEQAIMKGRRCGLNDEEIRNLFEMIMEDKKNKEAVEVKNKAEQMIYQSEKRYG